MIEFRKAYSKKGWERFDFYKMGEKQISPLGTRTFKVIDRQHIQDHVDWIRMMWKLVHTQPLTKNFGAWNFTSMELEDIIDALNDAFENEK